MVTYLSDGIFQSIDKIIHIPFQVSIDPSYDYIYTFRFMIFHFLLDILYKHMYFWGIDWSLLSC